MLTVAGIRRTQINIESLDKLREIHRNYQQSEAAVDAQVAAGEVTLEWRMALPWDALEALFAEAQVAVSESDGRAEKHALVLQATQKYAVKLGAARVTCCKSGKDRTGMVSLVRSLRPSSPSETRCAAVVHARIPSCAGGVAGSIRAGAGPIGDDDGAGEGCATRLRRAARERAHEHRLRPLRFQRGAARFLAGGVSGYLPFSSVRPRAEGPPSRAQVPAARGGLRQERHLGPCARLGARHKTIFGINNG